MSDDLQAELDGNTLRRLSLAIGGPDQKPNDGKNATKVSLRGKNIREQSKTSARAETSGIYTVL